MQSVRKWKELNTIRPPDKICPIELVQSSLAHIIEKMDRLNFKIHYLIMMIYGFNWDTRGKALPDR